MHSQRQQKADMDRIRAERDQLRNLVAPVKQPRVLDGKISSSTALIRSRLPR